MADSAERDGMAMYATAVLVCYAHDPSLTMVERALADGGFMDLPDKDIRWLKRNVPGFSRVWRKIKEDF